MIKKRFGYILLTEMACSNGSARGMEQHLVCTLSSPVCFALSTPLLWSVTLLQVEK